MSWSNGVCIKGALYNGKVHVTRKDQGNRRSKECAMNGYDDSEHV